MRIGLGYVKGVREEEMEALVAERERGGPYRGIADLASRSGAGRDGLERLAWAGALDGLPLRTSGEPPRGALASSASPGRERAGEAASCRCRSSLRPRPTLEPLGELGAVVADYRSTGDQPRRAPAGAAARRARATASLRSTDLKRIEDGSTVEVAGMVVARQRPETAKGITFMLLEDERGTVNLIVPPRSTSAAARWSARRRWSAPAAASSAAKARST